MSNNIGHFFALKGRQNLLILLICVNIPLSSDAQFSVNEWVRSTVCTPWNEVVKGAGFTDTELAEASMSRTRIQNFIKNSGPNILKLINNEQEFMKALLNCAYVEEILGDLHHSCVGDDGKELFPLEAIDACVNLKKSPGDNI